MLQGSKPTSIQHQEKIVIDHPKTYLFEHLPVWTPQHHRAAGANDIIQLIV